MTKSRFAIVVGLLAVAGPEAFAQRVPIQARVPRTARDSLKPKVRRRFLYERPTLSPWAGVDLGLAFPMARCDACSQSYSGWAPLVSAAAGMTLNSRLTFAVERSWMNVAFSRQDATADLMMVTARMGTRRGRLAKVGIGKGRYTEGPGQLVDDKQAWMLGGESCSLSRVDGCLFADYSQTGVSSARNVSSAVVHYRMHTLRGGLAFRFHLLRGRRITLPSRE